MEIFFTSLCGIGAAIYGETLKNLPFSDVIVRLSGITIDLTIGIILYVIVRDITWHKIIFILFMYSLFIGLVLFKWRFLLRWRGF